MASAKFVGTNNMQDVRPASHSSSNWAKSCFGSFGNGCFNPYYSAEGAFVVAGTGGHANPSNSGALIFDFHDFTWKFQACTNSSFTELDNTGIPADYAPASTSGSPHYEITGPTEVPAPTHPYAQSLAIDVGNKGTYLYVVRAAVTTTPNTSPSVHAFDIDTGVWTRFTSNTSARTSFDNTSILDEANNRVFLFTNDFQNYTSLYYLDLSDGTFHTLGSYNFPSGLDGTYTLDPVNMDVIAHVTTGNTLRKKSISSPNNDWVNMTVNGTLPAPDNNHWCYFPPDGKYYRVPTTGGNVINRMVVNGSVATIDTITLSGDTIPRFNDTSGDVLSSPYRALMYVPALGVMAWVSGNATAISNDQQVTLLDVSVPFQQPRKADPKLLLIAGDLTGFPQQVQSSKAWW